ncbi:MAG: hypothetical protein R2705_24140 [Ilumatobacteraceae bacterium]
MGTTVGRKLATAFVAMLMMFGLAASWVFVDLVRIHEDQDRIEQVLNPFSAAMTDVLVGTEAAANDERGFLLTGERAFIDVIEQQQLPKVAAALDDLERLGVEPDLVAVLRDQIDAWVASMFAEFDAFASDPEAARSMAFGPTRALRTTHETTAADLQAKATASLDGASRYLTSTTETAQVRIFLAFALGLSGAVVVVLLLAPSADSDPDLDRADRRDRVGRSERNAPRHGRTGRTGAAGGLDRPDAVRARLVRSDDVGVLLAGVRRSRRVGRPQHVAQLRQRGDRRRRRQRRRSRPGGEPGGRHHPGGDGRTP